MANKLNIVEFPRPRRPSREMDSDERKAADVFKAHRSLCRKIDMARSAGLTVECSVIQPRITRQH